MNWMNRYGEEEEANVHADVKKDRSDGVGFKKKTKCLGYSHTLV